MIIFVVMITIVVIIILIILVTIIHHHYHDPLPWSSSSPQALHSRFLPHMSSFVSESNANLSRTACPKDCHAGFSNWLQGAFQQKISWNFDVPPVPRCQDGQIQRSNGAAATNRKVAQSIIASPEKWTTGRRSGRGGFEPCINLGVFRSAGPLARQVFRIRRIGAAATTREAPTGKCSTIPLMGLMCWGWEHFMSSNQLEHWCLVWVGNRSPSLWRYPSERTRSQCWNVSHFFPFCLWIRSRQWIWRCIVILFVMQNKLLDEVGRCFRFRTLKLRTVVLSR